MPKAHGRIAFGVVSGTLMPKAHGWIAFGVVAGTFMPKVHGWIAFGVVSATLVLNTSVIELTPSLIADNGYRIR